MSFDGLEQLSAVMDMSRQRDGVALTRKLIEHLRKQLPRSEVCIFEVFGHRRLDAPAADLALADLTVRRFDEGEARTPHADLGQGVLQAVKTLQPDAMDNAKEGIGRLIIPISADIGPVRVIVLDAVAMDPLIRAKVFQVVDAYSNLIRLMDSRERDQLTGLLNRQIFATLFDLSSQRANAAVDVSLWLAVLDIDHFKQVNDTYGHLFGDEVLIHFARLMERTFRYTDELFRFGGEEFIVVLATHVDASPAGALERFRAAVEHHAFPGVGQVTVSIGYVECRTGRLPTTFVDQADKALYAAKDAGRNRIMHFTDIEEQRHKQQGSIDLF